MLNNTCSLTAIILLWLITMLSMPLSAVAGSEVACDIQHGPCIRETNGMAITFDVMPKPIRTMSELRFIVTMKKNNAPVTDASVSLDLSMPGMYMGKNRPLLKHLGQGVYQGTGIIPRCASGHKAWQALVTVDRGGPGTTALYQFEVP